MIADENARRKLVFSFKLFAKTILRIISKTEAGQDGLRYLGFNRAQQYLHDKLEEQKKKTGKVRAIVLKGRQQGCSTYVAGRFYHSIIHNRGHKAFIMAHDRKTTGILFETIQRFYKQSPKDLQPSTSKDNENHLVFDKLNSSFQIGTAGNEEVGRGMTIHKLHGSEVAFWAKGYKIAQGLMQAVPPMAGTEIILESTANGKGNFFHKQWQAAVKGESDLIAVFLPWYWQDEYRIPVDYDKFVLTKEEEELKKIYSLDDEQINFRRITTVKFGGDGSDGEWRFKQEYPFTAVEAFNTSATHSFIKESDILHARSFKAYRDPNEDIIMGVDPARFGDDRTAFIFRQGNVAFGLVSFKGLDNVQVADKIENALIKYPQITMVNIDLGGGQGIVDILNDRGYADRVTGINFGAEASMKDKYFNKRAEMWGEARSWLHTKEVEIPDNDELHEELVAPEYFYKKDKVIQLELKEKTKKRLGRSPDYADAFVLTFVGSFYSLDALAQD